MFTQNVFVQLNKYRLQQEACAVKRTGHVQHIRSWPQSRPSAALRRPVPLNLAPDKSYRRPLKVRFHPCIKYQHLEIKTESAIRGIMLARRLISAAVMRDSRKLPCQAARAHSGCWRNRHSLQQILGIIFVPNTSYQFHQFPDRHNCPLLVYNECEANIQHEYFLSKCHAKLRSRQQINGTSIE